MNIILLHGAIGTKKQMSSIKDALSTEHQVHAFDFPGHGEHPEMEQGFSIEVFENWVKDAIHSLEGDVAILGYSLGGYVGLRLAAQLPDKVKAVMTFGTIFNWHPEQATKQIGMINPEKIKEKVPTFAAILEETHGDKWMKVLYHTHHLLEKLGAKPLLTEENLSQITCPCIISVGDRDALVTVEESYATYKLIPNAAFTVYANTGHPIEKAPLEKIKRDFSDLLTKCISK